MRERERQTDRQTYKQTDRQTDNRHIETEIIWYFFQISIVKKLGSWINEL